MQVFKRHVFVCTNRRPEGHRRGDCCSKDAEGLYRKLKNTVIRAGLHEEIRINTAGCLDQCNQGPVLVVYPESIWYVNVSLDDVDEIVEKHLTGGKVVERLIMTRTDREP